MSRILNFQKPSRVVKIKSDETFGIFEFKPLELGYGLTIGNSLRRVLLSSLEGFAITSIKIEGVDHEFSTIEGVMEDVVNIVLNFKQVRFKKKMEDVENERFTVDIYGKEQFTAGDLDSFITSFETINKDFVICNMDKDVKLKIDITINKGRGYVHSEQNTVYNSDFGTIAIDSIYTPVKNVKYYVENFRVEQKTDYEKLIIEITTDGSISPENAIQEAAKILIYHFLLFSDKEYTLESFEEEQKPSDVDDDNIRIKQLLNTKLTEINLSVRALNCIKTANIKTLGELVTFNKEDLLKFRNFGRKSLSEIEELITSLGLTFKMDVKKYLKNN